MGYELITCCIFIILVIIFANNGKNKTPEFPVERLPLTRTKPKVATNIPLPQQLRRWQQSLIHREKDVFQREEYQTYKERETDLKERGVALERKEVELTDLMNTITNERTLAKLEQQEMQIELDGKQIEIKDLLSDLQHRENLLEVEKQELRLDGKEVQLKELLAKIWHEGNQVEQSKKELEIQARELEFNYNRKAFELEKSAQHIRNMLTEFLLEKKRWGIQQAQESLELYNQKIKLLEGTVTAMYNIRMHWLKIQGKENSLTNREQVLELQRWDNALLNREEKLGLQRWDNSLLNREEKLSIQQDRVGLQKLYDSTQSKIRELYLDKEEINLQWDKRELDSRWRSFRELQSLWHQRIR